jgi:hypothetical protein
MIERCSTFFSFANPGDTETAFWLRCDGFRKNSVFSSERRCSPQHQQLPKNMTSGFQCTVLQYSSRIQDAATHDLDLFPESVKRRIQRLLWYAEFAET